MTILASHRSASEMQLSPTPADPSPRAGRITHNQHVRTNTLGYHGSASDHCILSDGDSCQYHRAGSKRRALLNYCGLKPISFIAIPLVRLGKMPRTGVQIIGEEHMGPYEHSLFELHTLPNHVAVFHDGVVADDRSRFDVTMIANGAVFPDSSTCHYMCERPYPSSSANALSFD